MYQTYISTDAGRLEHFWELYKNRTSYNVSKDNCNILYTKRWFVIKKNLLKEITYIITYNYNYNF